MFRATSAAALALLAGLVLLAPPARAQDDVNFIDAVGYIDYTRPPDFKIGTWVAYHMAGTSASGLGDSYDLTISVVGEERFWGEDCFWIETVTERPGDAVTIASCISYDAFGDSLSDKAQLFERKTIMGVDENGKPIQNVMRRSRASYRSRETREGVIVTFDTLGTDTVITPRGTFDCLKVTRKEAVFVMQDQGDSTIRGETFETRTLYYAKDVPVTSLVREDLDNLMVRRAWRIGDSENAIESVVDHAVGSMRIVDWGDNATAVFVPEAFRKPLRRGKGPGKRAPGGG